MEYRLNTHLRSGEICFRVEAGQLVVQSEKQSLPDEIPFSQITRINLRQEMPGVFTARIHRRGGKTVHIPSRHFKGVGNFEDRSGEYRAFLEALHREALQSNSEIALLGGSTGLYVMGWFFVAITVLAIVALGVGVLILEKRNPPLRAMWFIPIALMVGGAFIRQGRLKPYSADDLPENLVPAGSS